MGNWLAWDSPNRPAKIQRIFDGRFGWREAIPEHRQQLRRHRNARPSVDFIACLPCVPPSLRQAGRRAQGPFLPCSLAPCALRPTPYALRLYPLRNTKHLTGLDHVRIRQLILVGLESFHVTHWHCRGDPWQSCSRYRRPCTVYVFAGGSGASWRPPVTWMSATMSSRQVGIVLIAFHSSFFLLFGRDRALEVQLALALLRGALKFALGRLNGVSVLYLSNP